jgi:hypothetical protein
VLHLTQRRPLLRVCSAVQGLHSYLMHEAQLMARKGEQPFDNE